MAGPREESSKDCLCSGASGLEREMLLVGDVEGLKGEELGVISRRGTEVDATLKVVEESLLSALSSRGLRVLSGQMGA